MALFRGGDGQERLGEMFHLSFSERDESLYLRPIPPTGICLCGTDLIPPHTESHEVNFRLGRFRAVTPVKLSIHASGQTHVKFDDRGSAIIAGPLGMPPLRSMRDEHIATIQVDEFSRLAPVRRQPTTKGTNVDFGFPFGDAPSGRVVLYANSVEPRFRDTDFFIALDRGNGNVLYVGLVGLPNANIASDPRGFTVLTGWDPLSANDPENELKLLFIRCE